MEKYELVSCVRMFDPVLPAGVLKGEGMWLVFFLGGLCTKSPSRQGHWLTDTLTCGRMASPGPPWLLRQAWSRLTAPAVVPAVVPTIVPTRPWQSLYPDIQDRRSSRPAASDWGCSQMGRGGGWRG